jgi:membrane protein YqaA with SNARE-associated domain
MFMRGGGAGLLKKEAEYSPASEAANPGFRVSIIGVMEAWMQSLIESLATALALPKFGLSTVFVVAFVSATLLPLGSEPAVFGLVKLNPHLFWPAVAVATAGNTLGGMVSWWMGRGAGQAYHAVRTRRHAHAPNRHPVGTSVVGVEAARPDADRSPAHQRASRWLQRYGAKACLLSWLPVVGDPLCAVAGWLKLPFWPCVVYMAIGKFARYLTMTAALLWFFPGQL